MLSALLGALACACLGAPETNVANDHPTILVESIRRQLMADNYDYMPSASEELFPGRHELSGEGAAPGEGGAAPGEGGAAPGEGGAAPGSRGAAPDSGGVEPFMFRAHEPDPAGAARDDSLAIFKKDLLYYVDDERLKAPPAPPAPPAPRYKLLKVKETHPNRRSGSYRRFIQEEKDGGVVIFNLNDEPIPEFRLPRSRRQYMAEPGGADSELEVAPASDSEEPPGGAGASPGDP